MQYAFLIDNRKCIGCHACTTACKSENQVPLGVNRTWVKYVEKGTFPDTRRYFQVTRCNHCANPPCVQICPVTAMFQRKDGIVEFDSELCIGCKACMQACPYDAIYIDPESHTAAKCHFCAHRTEVGLEPACVVVCPEHAIIAGDLEDPHSELARLVSAQQVRVRKPEQNTLPKLFYIDAEEVAIHPLAAQQSDALLWGDLPNGNGHGDWRGPIQIGQGKMATAMVRTTIPPRETYNVPHRIPWHWQVPAYLTTKSIGAGMFMLATAGILFGWLPQTPLFTSVMAFVSLLCIGITTGLLVWDLDRPERFWTILIRPQWKSWLARGAFILIGFSLVGGLFFVGHAAQQFGLFASGGTLANWLIVPGVVLAALSAIYTAFLFAQAEGRDLWQSTLLPWHLFVQAVMAGAGALLLLAPFFPTAAAAQNALAWTFGASVLANLFITVGGEFAVPHASAVAATAAHLITHGKYKRPYQIGIWLGLVAPLALTALAFFIAAPFAVWLWALAGILSIGGLFAYEWAFVMAPQEIPNN
jgi:Fe-S-cluster-containing dehydrogenase component/formate-dependent nitrite reductase membrane component NrfD